VFSLKIIYFANLFCIIYLNQIHKNLKTFRIRSEITFSLDRYKSKSTKMKRVYDLLAILKNKKALLCLSGAAIITPTVLFCNRPEMPDFPYKLRAFNTALIVHAKEIPIESELKTDVRIPQSLSIKHNKSIFHFIIVRLRLL
jgi:hypothetical protein